MLALLLLNVPHELVLLSLLDALLSLLLHLRKPLTDRLLLLLELYLTRTERVLPVDSHLPHLLDLLRLQSLLLFLHGLERFLHLLDFLLFLLENGAHLLLFRCLSLIAIGFGNPLSLLLVELFRELVVQLPLYVDGVLQRDLGRRGQWQWSHVGAGAPSRRGLLAYLHGLADESLLRGSRSQEAVEHAAAESLL